VPTMTPGQEWVQARLELRYAQLSRMPRPLPVRLDSPLERASHEAIKVYGPVTGTPANRVPAIAASMSERAAFGAA
jgi:hypothetical protein